MRRCSLTRRAYRGLFMARLSLPALAAGVISLVIVLTYVTMRHLGDASPSDCDCAKKKPVKGVHSVVELSPDLQVLDYDSKPPRFRVGEQTERDARDVIHADLNKPPVGGTEGTSSSSSYNNTLFGILDEDSVFNLVHYLWCEKKVFEFQHYLSIRSTIQLIQPERVVVHFAHYPRQDKQGYNVWFEDMKEEFPFIELHDMGANAAECKSRENMASYLRLLVNTQGGYYVHYNTIFTSFPLSLRKHVVVDALSDGVEGFLMAHQRKLEGDKLSNPKAGTTYMRCAPYADYHPSRHVCVIRKGPYFPRDAWDKDDAFSRSVNTIMYGRPTVPRAAPRRSDPIPNISHMIWIGGGKMDYLFYLSCLSQIHILKVDRLYIHGDSPPTGKYWNTLKKEETKVHYVHRTVPDLIFRKDIRVRTNMADVIRVDIMMRYGGIYTDVDALWVKPIPDQLRYYDAVANYDWPQLYDHFPDYIQNGVMMGRRGARVWHLFMESFKTFKDETFGYNGLLRPYKVYERHPDLVHIYDKLQVMCWHLLCHPTWYPNFRQKSENHKKYKDFDWRLAHVFHWTYPTPAELNSEESLLEATGLFADIGKHVLKAAGKLKKNRLAESLH